MPYLSYIITCYNDFDRLKSLVIKLAQHCLDTVSVITDGDNDHRIKQLCNEQKLNYYYFDRSYKLDNGFEFWRNVFTVYDKHPSEFLLKLDTDVDVRGKITITKEYNNTMFGSMFNRVYKNNTYNKYIQNGIRGFHKNVIEKMKQSKFYYDDIFFKKEFLKNNLFDSSNRLKSQGMISTDFLMYAMSKLENIQLKNHEQILSLWYNPKLMRYFENNLTKDQFLNLIDQKKPALIHPWYV
jgi:hypothetical protein